MKNFEDCFDIIYSKLKYSSSNYLKDYIGTELLKIFIEKYYEDKTDFDFPNNPFCDLQEIISNKTAFRTYQKKLHQVLFNSFTKITSFKCIMLDLTNLSTIIGVEYECFSKWEKRRKIKAISQSELMENRLIKRMFCCMPEPIIDCFDSRFQKNSVVYIYSPKMASYFRFVEENRLLIQNEFPRQHERIKILFSCLVTIINESENSVYSLLSKQGVMIGISEIGGYYEHLFIENISFNFYIAIIFLERYLDEINEFFNYTEAYFYEI